MIEEEVNLSLSKLRTGRKSPYAEPNEYCKLSRKTWTQEVMRHLPEEVPSRGSQVFDEEKSDGYRVLTRSTRHRALRVRWRIVEDQFLPLLSG